MKPALLLVHELVRVCACCREPLPKTKRAHAKTCGKACRQKLSRRSKVSCESVASRRKSVPVLSAAARARAGFDVSDVPREKRVILVGKVGGAEVRIG